MSEENFDKKIREKLSKHSPEYEKGAWDSFRKMLPAPWYIRAFRDYGGWLFGGLATTALVLTTIYQSQKTNRLNEEIFTLTEKLDQTSKTDTVFINSTSVDTVLVKETVTQYLPVERIVYIEKETAENSFKAPQQFDREKKIVLQNAGSNTSQKQNSVSEESMPSKSVANKESVTLEPQISRDRNIVKKGQNNDPLNVEEATIYDVHMPKSDVSEASATESNSADQLKDVTIAEEQADEAGRDSGVKETIKDSVNFDSLAEEEEIEPERTDPKKEAKKPINWPKLRAGISSDFIGFNSLLTGPTVEVFLMDKLSLNTGVLFSRQIETKHPLEKDFNRKTGKRFEEEYKRYIPKDNPGIKDISIKTSFIKMPVNFNYYINTWSRFSFMISAGTKLDLSVYQDVNFSSGMLGNQISRRFEARPKPKVFNNLFYGMGVQYQYRGFVAQLAPYFEFAFRNPDYFTPPRKVGVSGSLKFEFGK